MKSRFSRRAGALLLSLVLAFSLVPAAGAAVTDVSLNETALILKMGETETATLIATVTVDNGEDQTVTWESSDEDIAAVSGGIVTAKKARR